jgi:hypothetical protein
VDAVQLINEPWDNLDRKYLPIAVALKLPSVEITQIQNNTLTHHQNHPLGK